MTKSRLHKFNPDYTWNEIAKEPYKAGGGRRTARRAFAASTGRLLSE